MSGPEGRKPLINLSPGEKLGTSGLAFLAVVALAAPAPTSSEESKASPDNIDATEIAKCEEEYPPHTGTLTLNDYLDVKRWGGGYHPRPQYVGQDKKSLLQIAERRLRLNQLHAYEASPERAKQIETNVNEFAAGMVKRADTGDKTYTFYQSGSGAFLDGSFLTGQEGFEPAADDYEGFGGLWREVKDSSGKIVKREISDNIYRYEDGTYYADPHPWILGVSDKNAQSTFEFPAALGLLECSSVPGNGVTQGWRVSHYGYNFDSPNNVQLEPWIYNGPLADVKLADRRAEYFISDRYNPDAQQEAR